MQYQELMTATAVLMGLRYQKPLIEHLIQGVRKMEESVTWNIIEKRGEEKGEVKGERDALIRVGTRKLGAVTPAVQQRITQISSIEILQSMLDRVLDVKSWDELLQAV